MEKSFKDILLLNGYEEKGYGFSKQTENISHWVTLYDSESLQMYSYYVPDNDCEKIYDTGVININTAQLLSLIEILTESNYQ